MWYFQRRQRGHFNDPLHKSKRLRINIFVRNPIVVDVTFLLVLFRLLVTFIPSCGPSLVETLNIIDTLQQQSDKVFKTLVLTR
ncbi:hypothetical protein Z042_11625 [Chania multitudinisentens RB-25]|uniref:Uncharacterized protein n=2 Tax=Chania TaxID=1745211 RepID=W0LFX2_9GAMM|nr:hypothetical protein Z042_11625 [Chania multitudinisentens RB-25]